MNSVNDNEGWSITQGLAEIERKRQVMRDRLARQNEEPLTFKEKSMFKIATITLNEVENRVLNRVHGITKRPEVIPVKHPLNAFHSLYSNAEC